MLLQDKKVHPSPNDVVGLGSHENLEVLHLGSWQRRPVFHTRKNDLQHLAIPENDLGFRVPTLKLAVNMDRFVFVRVEEHH